MLAVFLMRRRDDCGCPPPRKGRVDEAAAKQLNCTGLHHHKRRHFLCRNKVTPSRLSYDMTRADFGVYTVMLNNNVYTHRIVAKQTFAQF